MLNFGRGYQLIIGRPSKLTSFVVPTGLSKLQIIDQGPPQTNSAGDVIDWNSIPPEWYEIQSEDGKGLQLSAKIDQTKNVSTPCTITITNALQENVDRLRKDDLVILRAGYTRAGGDFIQAQGIGVGREQWPDLFVGQIHNVDPKFKGTDRVTTITCAEAITVKKNSKVSRAYVPGITRLSVLNDMRAMLNTQGVPLGNLQLPKEGTQELLRINKPFLTGFNVKGYLLEEFEKYCTGLGLVAYTAVGKIYIEPLVSTPVFAGIPQAAPVVTDIPSSVEIFKIDPSQVRGRVQPLSDNSGQGSNTAGESKSRSIKLTVGLDGNVTIAKVIRLSGFKEEYNGDWQISSVQHNLDFRSDSKWETTITAKR